MREGLAEPGRVLAGIDVGGTQCSVNVAVWDDEALHLTGRDQFATQVERGPNAILDDIADRLEKLVPEAGQPEVVGISCGGPLDTERGLVLSPPNLPDWKEVPIVDRLSDRLGMRCVLENDANASALAEWALGAGRGTRNLIYLTLGTGLGAGLILDGVLYRGTGGLAGEVGHWRLGPETGPLHYGKQGTLEGLCSGGGITGWYCHLAGEERAAASSAAAVADRARQGDPRARNVFAQAGRYLGRGVAMLVDAFAPEVIVIGGLFVYARELLEAEMHTELETEAHPTLLRNCRVVPAELGAWVGSYASCCVALRALSIPIGLGSPMSGERR